MLRAQLRPKVVTPMALMRRAYTQPPQARRRVGYGTMGTTVIASSCVAYFVGVHYPPRWNPFLFMRTKHEIHGADKLSDSEYCAAVERRMHELPFVKQLQAHSFDAPSAKRVKAAAGVPETGEGKSKEEAHYYAVRPFTNLPPERLEHNLTGSTLRGRDRFAVTPLVFSKTEKGAADLGGRVGDGYAIIHIGRDISGFEGVIHGGMIATLFDEALARSAMHALPNNIGVTARLDINYRRPVPVDQFIVIETQIIENAGRKAIVKAELRDVDSHTVLAEADSVFVEPKMAKFMKWVGGLNVKRMLEE
ncbi:hypothetical protein MCUN1_000372 [Malassezia cuniculi]|uniref:Thioesterase domain-containing protein n=1 Tax=Malassezia cuniculi TaxID=948313 RepID=A0AAF0ER02_9BASI|nr:hypothetical protein MCUN1_000372 [Malassezia cuniculi]